MLLFSMYKPPIYTHIPCIYAHLKQLTNLYKPRAYSEVYGMSVDNLVRETNYVLPYDNYFPSENRVNRRDCK